MKAYGWNEMIDKVCLLCRPVQLERENMTIEIEQTMTAAELEAIIKDYQAKLTSMKASRNEKICAMTKGILEAKLSDISEKMPDKTFADLISKIYWDAVDLVGDEAEVAIRMDASDLEPRIALVKLVTMKGTKNSPAGRYSLSTAELLKLHGEKIADEGKTWKELIDEADQKYKEGKEAGTLKGGNNFRQAVRNDLIAFHKESEVA